MLTVAPGTNVKDVCVASHFNNNRISSNVSVSNIQHASQTNDAIAHFEEFSRQLNDTFQRRQDLLFEGKLAEFNEQYRQSNFITARSRMYRELVREVDLLEQEERREDEVQDPPEMKGSRTFERGGPRRRTGAELAMKELEKSDKLISKSERRKQSFTSQKPSTSPQKKPSRYPTVPAKNTFTGLISGAHLPAEELARFVIKRDAQLAAQRPS